MMEHSLLIAAGGFFGAMARYGFTQFLTSRWQTALPLATLFINILGSFLLGWMAGAGVGGKSELLLGTGFMGAFTTFATVNLESVNLLRNGKIKTFATYMMLMYTLGIAAAIAGWACAR